MRARTAGRIQVLRRDDGGGARPLTGVGSLADLLRLSLEEIQRRCDSPGPAVIDAVEPVPLPDGRMEVWAAGVTYQRSRSAREEESAAASVYELVYDAERPEIFFKAPAWRVVTDGDAIAIRADSEVNVPEPELAVVVNAHGEIVAYTVCNDMSSRSIEGENPLYLPQAKIYDRSCAVAATMRPAWEVDDPYDLAIRLTIERDDAVVWSGTSSTSLLHRRLPDLVGYLFRSQSFPDGVILSTGTPLVPELSFRLLAGDVVAIEIEGIGSLRNPVVTV